ncbi:MAG: histidine kinase, partial [Acidimicrobiia bacterium]|nr:histidine kinase [Acidimicrobiia bacterium]
MAEGTRDRGRFRYLIERRHLVFDLLLALGFLILGLATVADGDAGGSAFTREPDALNTALILLGTLPLIVRRRYPVAVLVVMLLAWGLDRALDYPPTVASSAVVVGFHTIGTELTRDRALRIGGLAAVAITGWTAIGAVALESVAYYAVLFQLLITAVPLWLGMEIHDRRRRIEELKFRAEQAERDREQRIQRAVSEERARIARELHDVVAHQITVIAVQADGARRIVGNGDPRVGEALDNIVASGKSAMTEMRRMVGLLRNAEDGTGDDGADRALAPLPTLADIDYLVDQVKGAGMPVSVEIGGARRHLDDGAELSAFRVIQEALTNALRHGGPGVTAKVEVEYGESELSLRIE